MELLSTGIDVVLVEPGNMDTSRSSSGIDNATPKLEEMIRDYPNHEVSVLRKYRESYERAAQMREGLTAQSTHFVCMAHEHIIRAKWVHPRYVCGWDSMMSIATIYRLPEWIRDRVMIYFTVKRI